MSAHRHQQIRDKATYDKLKLLILGRTMISSIKVISLEMGWSLAASTQAWRELQEPFDGRPW